jgi:hypothetical protein
VLEWLGTATKFIFPMEFTNLLSPFMRMANRPGDGADDSGE